MFNPNVVALNDETIRISWEPPPTYTSELLIYYTLEITSLPSGPDNLILPPMNMPVEVLYQVVNPLCKSHITVALLLFMILKYIDLGFSSSKPSAFERLYIASLRCVT